MNLSGLGWVMTRVGDRVVGLLPQRGDGGLGQLRGELGIEGDDLAARVIEVGLGEEAGFPTVVGVEGAALAPADGAGGLGQDRGALTDQGREDQDGRCRNDGPTMHGILLFIAVACES